MSVRSSAFVALGAASLSVACGPSLAEISGIDPVSAQKLSNKSMRRAERDTDRACALLDGYVRAGGGAPGHVERGVMACWQGELVDATSPFDGATVKTLDRGVLAMRAFRHAKIYDGQFMYFFGNPAKHEAGALVFIGRVTTPASEATGAAPPTDAAPSTGSEPTEEAGGTDDASEAFGLYMADQVTPIGGHVGYHAFVRAERAYLEGFERRHAVQVQAFQEQRARDEAAAAAAWSLGEALVLGLGGRLLATGNAKLDDLVETGLGLGVDVARDGAEQATADLVAKQRARLEGALEDEARRALARGIKAATR